MKHTLTLPLALCLLLLTGCVQQVPVPAPPAPPTPSVVQSWDQTTYEGLIAAQEVLRGLRDGIGQFPQLKPQLNGAIAAYNVAQRAFKTFEVSARAPSDRAAIQQQMIALTGKIVALQAAIAAGKGGNQ